MSLLPPRINPNFGWDFFFYAVYLVHTARTEQLVDLRDIMTDKEAGTRLFPYAKEVHYHPSGILSMTLEIYDDFNTQEYSFGFNVHGKLKEFLDQLGE